MSDKNSLQLYDLLNMSVMVGNFDRICLVDAGAVLLLLSCSSEQAQCQGYGCSQTMQTCICACTGMPWARQVLLLLSPINMPEA